MKALSIWPEWAFAITHLAKRVENRGWRPPSKVIGCTIAIHAGRQFGGKAARPQAMRSLKALKKMAMRNGWTEAGFADVLEQARAESPSESLIPAIHTGAIVGTAKIAQVREPIDERERWALGPLCWVLEDVRRLQAPIPCRGRQGVWNLPDAVMNELVVRHWEPAEASPQ